MPTRDAEVKITVFNIDKCGYHVRSRAEAAVCTRATLFPDLHRWVGSRGRLSATRTEAVTDDDEFDPEDAEKGPLLCRASKKLGDEYLFAMFQVLGNSRYAVSRISANARVNEDMPTPVDVGTGNLAGASCYFWALPSEQVLCSVRLSAPGTNVKPFVRWLKGYQLHWSDRVEKLAGVDGAVTLLERGASRTDSPRLWPQFVAREAEDGEAIRRATTTPSDIRAVWFKGKIPRADVNRRLGNLFGSLPSMVPSQPFRGRTVDARVTMKEATPSGLQGSIVRNMIREWQEIRESMDLGFQFSNGQKVWLNRPKPLRHTISLRFDGRNEDQVDLGHLISTLSHRFKPQVIRTAQACRLERGHDDDSDG